MEYGQACHMIPEGANKNRLKIRAAQLKIIKQLLTRKDVKQTAVIADRMTGREGELVARWILDMLSLKNRYQRFMDFINKRSS